MCGKTDSVNSLFSSSESRAIEMVGKRLNRGLPDGQHTGLAPVQNLPLTS